MYRRRDSNPETRPGTSEEERLEIKIKGIGHKGQTHRKLLKPLFQNTRTVPRAIQESVIRQILSVSSVMQKDIVPVSVRTQRLMSHIISVGRRDTFLGSVRLRETTI